MKKFILVILLFAILIFNAYSKQEEFEFSSYFNIGKITNYTNINNKSKFKGQTIYFEGDNLSNTLNVLQAEIKFVEYIKEKDLTICYCVSPKIKNNVNVKDHNINLQIAVCNEYTVAGWPMILGDF